MSDDEYEQICQSAAKAGLPLSTFVKRVCLGIQISSTVDSQAVLALAKANADLGRLGGLFKMFLSEGKAGQYAEELRDTLQKIETTKDIVERKFDALIQEFGKKSRGQAP